MTAETLKPFITPPSVDNFPATHLSTSRRRQRNGQIIAIGLGVTAVVLATVLLGFTIYNTISVFHLKEEVKHLNHIVESMQNRLGLHYLDDLKDFEKEYSNVIFDSPRDKDDSDEDDEDEDEDDDIFSTKEYDEYKDVDIDDDNYDDMVKKYNSYDDDSDEEEDDDQEINTSDDANPYDDFEKFNDSKKKRQGSSRKSRSISQNPLEIPIYETSYFAQLNKTANADDQQGSYQLKHQTRRPTMRPQSTSGFNNFNSKSSNKRHIVAENFDSRRSPLRQRGHHRRRKIPVVKSGDSILSAKSAGLMNSISSTPAAHFHLHRKVSDRNSVDAIRGDIYIGHPANELATLHNFKVDAGKLIIREAGLYYIYAQVCYNNTYDQNGYVIFHGHKAFLQCLNTVPTNMPKLHTCHTSGLIHLGANDTIHLRDFHSDRNVILKDDNNKSYFGIIKI